MSYCWSWLGKHARIKGVGRAAGRILTGGAVHTRAKPALVANSFAGLEMQT
jgi:hypothetical protein